MFITYTFGIALCLVFSSLLVYSKLRDPFHPIILFSFMLGFLYVVMPLQLEWSNSELLRWYLSEEQLEYVQLVNLAGVCFLVLGLILGGGGLRRVRRNPPADWLSDARFRARLSIAAKALGIVGALAFSAGIANVGGFSSAYGHSYGGGGHSSGYLREAYMFGLPAILMILYGRSRSKLSQNDLFWLALCAGPLLIHGLLGARRGPTFMILAAIGIGWYLFKWKRPSFMAISVAAAGVAVLLLTLVANRAVIHLGSDFELDRSPRELFSILEHNEFTYGGASILHADIRNEYWWGRRYIAVFFIRPIPRQIWPNKYQDAAELLDIPNLDEGNMGTGAADFKYTVGWSGAFGAATGLVADMWIEFSGGMSVVLFLLGTFFGRIWRLAVTRGGLPMLFYALLTSLSAYLVMQSLEAFGFRALLLSGGLFAAWKYAASTATGARTRRRHLSMRN